MYASAAAAGAITAMALIHGYLIMEPKEFLRLVNSIEDKSPVIVLVTRQVGVVHKRIEYIYTIKYGEFIVLTKSESSLPLPPNTRLIMARRLILPPAVSYRL